MMMDGETSMIVVLAALAGLGFAYVLIQIHKSRPEVARGLELLLALVQVGLIVTQCLGGQNSAVGHQQNITATLDALRPQLDVLLLTAEAQLTLTSEWQATVTPTPTPTASSSVAPTNATTAAQTLNLRLQIAAGHQPTERNVWLNWPDTAGDK